MSFLERQHFFKGVGLNVCSLQKYLMQVRNSRCTHDRAKNQVQRTLNHPRGMGMRGKGTGWGARRGTGGPRGGHGGDRGAWRGHRVRGTEGPRGGHGGTGGTRRGFTAAAACLHSTAGTTYPPSVGGRGAALPLNPHYLHDHRLPREPTKSQGSKLIPRNWSNFDHIREPRFRAHP